VTKVTCLPHTEADDRGHLRETMNEDREVEAQDKVHRRSIENEPVAQSIHRCQFNVISRWSMLAI
jgi:hypothetical protein